MQLEEKYEKLKKYLTDLGSVLVAFSGGVDSTFLLYAAKDALGDKAGAVTAHSCVFPKREEGEAYGLGERMGVRQYILEADELAIPGFAENPTDRCYICKKQLFQSFLALAEEKNYACVIEGSNLDDEGDYRPGLKAVAELGIKSPLRTLGFTKAEIRALSKQFNLPTWEKPSFACLASRIPYGEEITAKKLSMVEEAEDLLLAMGFQQFRVRMHGDKLARIELLPEDFPRMMEEENRKLVYTRLQECGFSYVSLDLKGYRTGSLNETLKS